MPNILAFRTPHESDFLVFGVSNAKYLAFDTPDENALIFILNVGTVFCPVSINMSKF